MMTDKEKIVKLQITLLEILNLDYSQVKGGKAMYSAISMIADKALKGLEDTRECCEAM